MLFHYGYGDKRVGLQQGSMKNLLIGGVAAIAMFGASLNDVAHARQWHGGYGAPPPYVLGARPSYPGSYGYFYYGGNYGYPYYGYYGGGFEGCSMQLRTVRFTRNDHPIKKRVRVCY